MSVSELNTTGHRTALQLNCTIADTSVGSGNYIFVRTSLEGQDLQQLQYGTANAKDITLSFWVKSSKAGVYSVVLNKNSATRTQIPLEYTISSADTWEKKTITITPTMGSTNLIAVAGGVIDNNTSAGLQINFTLMIGDTNEATADTWVASSSAWGTNAQVNWANETNNFYLTGVQLELGSNATPFEHRSYGEELDKCKRYYDTYTESGQAWIYIEGSPAHYKWWSGYIPRTMRAAPTVDLTGLSLNNGDTNSTGGHITARAVVGSIYNGPSRYSVQATHDTTGGSSNSLGHQDGWAGDSVTYTAEI
jgi:hypothetical protein